MGAGHLKIGEKIKQADGTTGLVANVTTVEQTREMFNLTVDEAHTFYVGTAGWLVHNGWRCGDWEIGLGKVVETTTTNKGAQKIDILFSDRNDAMVWAQKQLGVSIVRVYDASGKWIGWTNKAGDKVYWGHGDWGQGVGKSTFPYLNFEINGTKVHLFLRDKIENRGMLQDFVNIFNLK